MDKYFGGYFGNLGINRKQFLALGRVDANNDSESFKMPILAVRLSSYRNGVSKLHGQVSRDMWSFLWPGLPVEEVPIKSITNGVHVRSWLADEVNSLYERYLGPEWLEGMVTRSAWERIEHIPDEELWRAHQLCKERLIVFARHRLKAQMQRRGTYHTELNWAEEVLDPEALTIGFARRFASYKRGNLLLRDPQRLVKLLADAKRPVQIIFSGKAHPRDTEGKEIIRQIIHFAAQYDVRRRIVFLEDYDINVARYLVRGVDVWLSTPRRPMEASSTSGMKAAINGALNMSTLDGWWCEGYTPDGGWVIGSSETSENADYQDTVESQAIYNILQNEVVPLFYTRSADNVPRAWVKRMKNAIQSTTYQFNTHRMVCEYTRRFYNPAAVRWRYLAAEAMSRVKALAMWKSNMKKAWGGFAVKDVIVEAGNGQEGPQTLKPIPVTVGSQVNVRVLVKLGGVEPDDVSVELYYGCVDALGNISAGSTVRMSYADRSQQQGEHWFEGVMPCEGAGQYGFAVRILPRHTDLADPYELGLILWERHDS
jgi:starch phosphorylase